MEPASLTLWICLVLNYVVVTALLARGFSRQGGVRPRMRLLGLLVATCGATTIHGLLVGAPGMVRSLGACLVFLLSTLLMLWAWSTLRTAKPGLAFSGHRPLHLVATGPYRWIRHPLYTSYLASGAAGFVATGSPLTLAIVALLAALYAAAARDEDRVLSGGELGGAHAVYRSATGAFLPKLRSRPAPLVRRMG